MNDTEMLLNRLRNEVHSHKGKIAIAFSGGLDSSVLAKIASEEGKPVLYTAGVKGCRDFEAAESAAGTLELPLKKLVLKGKQISEAAGALEKTIGNSSRLIISYLLPLWFVCENCGEKKIMSGQGADELFGGYAKYQKMGRKELTAALEKDSKELKGKKINFDKSIAREFSKELIAPFLSDGVFEFALRLPLERKISSGRRKIILREVAELLGLGEIAERKKKAAQYGSGIAGALRRMK